MFCGFFFVTFDLSSFDMDFVVRRPWADHKRVHQVVGPGQFKQHRLFADNDIEFVDALVAVLACQV